MVKLMLDPVGAEYGLFWSPYHLVNPLADRVRSPLKRPLLCACWHMMPVIRGSSSISWARTVPLPTESISFFRLHRTSPNSSESRSVHGIF